MALVAAVAAKRAADVDALLASGRVDLRRVSDGTRMRTTACSHIRQAMS